MKNILIFMLLLVGTVQAQLHFTDPALKAVLLSANETNNIATSNNAAVRIDTNLDGEIQASEALLIQSLLLQAPEITNIEGIEAFSNLETMLCTALGVTAISLSGMPNLQQLTLTDFPALTTVNANNLTGLTTIHVMNNPLLTSLNLSGNANLSFIFANNNKLTSINVTGNTALTNLDASFNQLTTFEAANLANLTNLRLDNNHLTSINVNGCSTLSALNCYNNELTTLDLRTTNMTQLDASSNQLTHVNLTGCTDLANLNLSSNQFSAIDLSGFVHLDQLLMNNNQMMRSANLSGCIALTNLLLPDYLKSIDLTNCSSLVNFIYLSSDSLIETVSVQGCSALTTFHLRAGIEKAPLAEMNFSGLNQLTSIVLEETSLASINISGCSSLVTFTCFNNFLTDVDFSDSPLLRSVNLERTLLQTLDLSNLQQLTMLSLNFNPQLTTVFAKNGSRESFIQTTGSPLLFVCQDEAYLNQTRNELLLAPNPNAVANSYCSVTPGGDFNTISGLIRFDGDSNGCDAADATQPNIRVNINDGTSQGGTFTTANGNYTFYTEAGSFDLTPNIENPDWFSFAPATATVAFPDNLNHTTTQDFCITAVGTHNDAEIVFAPVSGTRPGFTSTYLLTIRNKGNQMLSGTYNLNYDGTLMNFVSAGTVPTSVSAGVLNWTYSNLQPFENRAFYVEMNVNTPTQTPPVNIDDILTFTATINPIVGDANPLDNQFVYNEVVIGSFDPNDISCLQGETVAPDAIGDYLHYIVNFENTGNAAAENVVVKLEINPNEFDVNSLQLLHASHASFSVIKNNTVEFKFPNINLRPSAGDPPVNGHGNILFKIKSKATLEVGDVVKNKAEIFFDYNFPIETNDAETTFRTLSNTAFETDNSLTIHPNPTQSVINLKGKYTIKMVELFDIQGRVLQTTSNNSDMLTLDISDRQNGLYFIKITTEKGVNVEKIVKK